MTGMRVLPVLLLAAALLPAPARAARRSPDEAARVFTVAVLGDGFGDVLADGLRMNYANQSDTAVLNKTHAPYGLSQDASFDWLVAARSLFASQGPVDAAVVMLGAQDTRPLRDGSVTVAPGSARWTALYGDRVQALAALFRDKGVPLTWVGLPVAGDPRMAADFSALNEILRDRAAKGGASYVDSWDAFVDENGQYSQTGPDLNGRRVKLRLSDGLDFTRAGARKLASFVEPDLRQDRDRTRPVPADPSAVTVSAQPEALNIDINAQIRREAGLAALPSSGPGEGGRPSAPTGPVVTLTAPALASDGRLVEPAASPALADLGGTPTQRALVQGQPVQPRPGRMDDFAWPRP